MAKMFVRLVELLLGSPPRLDCLKYVCDHLLLPDVNEVKLVRGSVVGPLEETIGMMEGEASPLLAISLSFIYGCGGSCHTCYSILTLFSMTSM